MWLAPSVGSAVLAAISQVQDGLLSIITVACLLFVSWHMSNISAQVGKVAENGEGSSRETRRLSRSVAQCEVRLMGLEFSPYECQRQVSGHLQKWDFAQNMDFAHTKAFDELSKYARSFQKRTQTPATSTMLSLIINMAIQTSRLDPGGRNIQHFKTNLLNRWHIELPGQPQQGYDDTASITQAAAAMPEAQLADFFGFTR